MKFVIILFLCMLRSGPEVQGYDHVQRADTLDKYIRMEQDVTSVELDRQMRFRASKQVDLAEYEYGLIQSNMPVIRRAPLSPWNYWGLPMPSELRRDRLYAVLPSSVSFPKSKARFADPALLKRTGRKEKEILDSEYYRS